MTADEGEVRRRTTAAASSTSTSRSAPASAKKSVIVKDETPSYSISALDILRMLGGLALAGTLVVYLLGIPLPRPWWTNPSLLRAHFTPKLELTNAELAAYDGTDPSKPILLAINRTIYDVSSSAKIYGPGGAYSQLAAKDASRSYVTTCFDPVHDLVPYLSGVEEIYVPLWLSKNPPQDELDAIAEGEVIRGMGIEAVINQLKTKIGRKNIKKLQKEAYETARERVRAQIKTWEGMFAKKAYPIVGRVVGVDESVKKNWRDLRFCEEAKAQRPDIAESLSKAMTLMTGSEKIDLSKMASNKKNPVMQEFAKKGGKDQAGGGVPKRSKGEKGENKKEKVPAEASPAPGAPAADGDSEPLDEDQEDIAAASVEDMMKGGKFGGKAEKKNPKIKERERADKKVHDH